MVAANEILWVAIYFCVLPPHEKIIAYEPRRSYSPALAVVIVLRAGDRICKVRGFAFVFTNFYISGP
jgi:hypothetical protein